jgi:SecD/SecF fusion protein
MSEVLTRSLITGLSTVFLLAMILLFGGETLRDFAFAMMIGVLSGTYSSIFIASPVLTAWKQREHSYRLRAARIEESMGYVPAYPEDNVVAKLGDDGDDTAAIEPGTQPAPVGAAALSSDPLMIDDAGAGKGLHVPEANTEAPAPSRADVELPVDSPAAETAPPPAAPGSASAEPDPPAEPDPQRERQKRRRQQRKRRKHGRHR